MKKIFLGIVCCLGIGLTQGYSSSEMSADEEDLSMMTDGNSIQDQLKDLNMDLSETEEIVKNDNQLED